MQQMMGVFESSYDFIQEENMREIIQLVVSFTGSLGCISGSRVHNARSGCGRFLVNRSYYFVCRMYGKNS